MSRSGTGRRARPSSDAASSTPSATTCRTSSSPAAGRRVPRSRTPFRSGTAARRAAAGPLPGSSTARSAQGRSSTPSGASPTPTRTTSSSIPPAAAGRSSHTATTWPRIQTWPPWTAPPSACSFAETPAGATSASTGSAERLQSTRRAPAAASPKAAASTPGY